MAGWQDMNGSMSQTVTSCITHNISSTEEKVNTLKRERSMDEDLSVLSIRSVSSAVGRSRDETADAPTSDYHFFRDQKARELLLSS
jgi:hypothetical protein